MEEFLFFNSSSNGIENYFVFPQEILCGSFLQHMTSSKYGLGSSDEEDRRRRSGTGSHHLIVMRTAEFLQMANSPFKKKPRREWRPTQSRASGCPFTSLHVHTASDSHMRVYQLRQKRGHGGAHLCDLHLECDAMRTTASRLILSHHYLGKIKHVQGCRSGNQLFGPIRI